MKLGKILASVNNKKNAYFNNQLKDLGLSYGQALVINVVYNHGIIQQDALTKDLEIDKSAVTRILKTLEEKKCIEKHMCYSDHRVYEISLTKKGEDVYPQIRTIIDNMTKVMLKDISDNEAKQLVDLLYKIRKNLEEENE